MSKDFVFMANFGPMRGDKDTPTMLKYLSKSFTVLRITLISD